MSGDVLLGDKTIKFKEVIPIKVKRVITFREKREVQTGMEQTELPAPMAGKNLITDLGGVYFTTSIKLHICFGVFPITVLNFYSKKNLKTEKP